jgi:hypothetical protein
MKHYDEEILEKFALKPVLFNERMRKEIRTHFRECSLCLAIFKYFYDFYKDFNESSARKSPQVERFVGSLNPVIPIAGLDARKHREPGMYMSVLAAMSATQGSDRFRSVATLASEEQQAVVRILQDNSTKKLRFFVLTDDPRKRSHALLSFPEISANFVTDRRGQLEVDFPHLQWDRIRGFLRIAVGIHTINTQNLTGRNGGKYYDLNGELHTVTVAYQDKKLHITTSRKRNYTPDLSIAVISGENDHTYFIPLKKGAGDCTIPLLPGTLTLRLYY